MIRITRWQPFWQVGSLQRQTDDVFTEWANFDLDLGMARLSAVDVQETDNEIILRAWLFGIDPRDIDIQITSEAVTLSGQHRSETDYGYGRRFSYGEFWQAIALPTQVKSNQAQADFRRGSLVLTMPKAGRHTQPLSIGRSRPTPPPSSLSSMETVTGVVQDQINQLTRGWAKAKHWLGRQMQSAADKLLAD